MTFAVCLQYSRLLLPTCVLFDLLASRQTESHGSDM